MKWYSQRTKYEVWTTRLNRRCRWISRTRAQYLFNQKRTLSATFVSTLPRILSSHTAGTCTAGNAYISGSANPERPWFVLCVKVAYLKISLYLYLQRNQNWIRKAMMRVYQTGQVDKGVSRSQTKIIIEDSLGIRLVWVRTATRSSATKMVVSWWD